MKKIEEVNLALLLKWKWGILTEKGSIWLNILKARYKYIRKSLMEGISEAHLKHCSSWWKDLLLIGNVAGGMSISFSNNVAFRIGDGSFIIF